MRCTTSAKTARLAFRKPATRDSGCAVPPVTPRDGSRMSTAEERVPLGSVSSNAPSEASIESIGSTHRRAVTMIDSTGNGQADLLFVDTTGDGQPDRPCHHYGVDTTGDGRTDALLADTTGDGQADSLVLDTTGNGLPDTAVSGVMVDISGDGKPDMVLLDDQPNDCDDPAVRDRISTDLVSIYGAETNALSETNALHSKAPSPDAAPYPSPSPSPGHSPSPSPNPDLTLTLAPALTQPKP